MQWRWVLDERVNQYCEYGPKTCDFAPRIVRNGAASAPRAVLTSAGQRVDVHVVRSTHLTFEANLGVSDRQGRPFCLRNQKLRAARDGQLAAIHYAAADIVQAPAPSWEALFPPRSSG